jgi:hypothetical protein
VLDVTIGKPDVLTSGETVERQVERVDVGVYAYGT